MFRHELNREKHISGLRFSLIKIAKRTVLNEKIFSFIILKREPNRKKF